MKETLQTFFERTAHSRDASVFLSQYHRVDPDRFLMLIPKFDQVEALDVFVDELAYLIKLELYPTLMLCEEFLNASIKQRLMEKLREIGSTIKFLSCKASELVEQLSHVGEDRPYYKYMMVDRPLQSESGGLINLLHLNMVSPSMDEVSKTILNELQPFLRKMGPEFAMQLVRPGKILEELFTKRGAGTLLSLGYQFELKSVKQIDMNKLIKLLEKGFGRKLKSDYLSKMREIESSVLIERGYRGGIVIQHFGDLHYLDKVVVAPEYFGRGMGSLLLDELTTHLEQYSLEHPKLIWRARPDNPFLPRYASLVYDFAQKHPGQCGTLCDGAYVYHFIGLDAQERARAFDIMKELPNSFE